MVHHNVMKILTITVAVMLVLTTPVYANALPGNAESNSERLTLDEAKEYLLNYKGITNNIYGGEVVVEYSFKSTDDFEKAAIYIVDNGVDAFHESANRAAQELGAEEGGAVPVPIVHRTVDPSSITVTISGNGTHRVEETAAYAIATFESLGSVEYKPTLGYTVTVEKGKIVSLSKYSFSPNIFSPAGSWDSLRYEEYNTGTRAGVTANFTISKTIDLPIGDFSVERTETDSEIFTVIVFLE